MCAFISMIVFIILIGAFIFSLIINYEEFICTCNAASDEAGAGVGAEEAQGG